jgi:hypothetical protein
MKNFVVVSYQRTFCSIGYLTIYLALKMEKHLLLTIIDKVTLHLTIKMENINIPCQLSDCVFSVFLSCMMRNFVICIGFLLLE